MLISIGKITVSLFIIAILFSSCQISSQEDTDKFQVYEPLGSPFNGNMDVIGIPRIMQMRNLRWGFTSRITEDPWNIRGYIRNGKMNIIFPDKKFEITQDYSLDSIDSVTIFDFWFEEINNIARCIVTGMPRPIRLYRNYSTVDKISWVHILYATDDFDRRFEEGRLRLKAGWNFVEIRRNPASFSGSNVYVPWFIFGLISQNINDFYVRGYRWQMHTWN